MNEHGGAHLIFYLSKGVSTLFEGDARLRRVLIKKMQSR